MARFPIWLCLIVACLARPASQASAADYFIHPTDGADANDGSIDAPWQHLSVAGRRLRPGDTVYLRGGTYRDDSLFTTTDGTEEAPITVTTHAGEKAVITGKGIYDQVVHLNNDHYVLSGLTFENTRCYNVLYLNSSEHNTIRDCRFSKQSGTMILIRGGGYHTIEKNTFDTTGSPEGPGSGDHVYVAGSHHNLIQGNHFVRAGHAACDQIESGELRSHHNILRNNLVEQHWGGGFYVIRGSSRSLLENNRIYYAGQEMEYPKAGFQLAADDNIVRFNVVAETGARPHSHNGISIAGYRFSGIDQHARNNAVYHNVLYKIGGAAVAVTQRQACKVTGNRVFNNVIYHGRVGGPGEPWWPDGNYYLTFETYHALADNKWSSFPNDNCFHHNLILHADKQGDHPGEDPLLYYEQENWGHSLAWAQAKFPQHFYENLEENPRFVDAPGRDFRLRHDSPAIDRGDFLTRTTAAGENTAAVPVADASLFCDGWERIEGDLVQVGTNRPVRIRKADYDANVLTVEAPVSFAEGDPVSLPWDGAAPDLGVGSVRTDSKQARVWTNAKQVSVRTSEMSPITKPVKFHTPEADAILSALEVFPADNPWNRVVSDWPLHPSSAKIIASIGVDKPLRYNADMAFILVPPDQKRVEVKIVGYPDESDPGPFPVPDETPIEGWPAYYQREAKGLNLSLEDVQRDKLNRGGDRHAIVVDPVNRMLYEFFAARKTDAGWQAAQASVFDLKTNALRPDGWTSADAAGLPIFPAVVRYDELQRGRIEHAMRVTVRKTRRAYVAPATHFASRHQNEDYPRMGERIRLRGDYDVSGFSPEVRAILNGLKKYGMFVADNGIEWAISVAPDPRIGVLHEELRRVRGSAFEVVVAPE